MREAFELEVKEMSNVATIVVTYNRKDLLLENIEHLLAQTVCKKQDIIIIDNASTDGTKEYIQKYIDGGNVTYLNTGKNLGGAGGFQYGVKYAAKKDYQFIWLMDDDSIPRPDALEKLLMWDSKLGGKYGFLASKVLWTDGAVCNMNIQKTSISRKVTDFSTEKVRIVTSTFVSMFMRTKRVHEVGLPIKEFFIWCDDIEYTRRLSKQYPCYLINSSVVVHKTGSNVGSNIAVDSQERLGRYNYAYRNEVFFFKREGWKGFFYHSIRLCSHVTRVLLKASDHKKERLQVIFKATREGFLFHPQIEYLENDKS